MSLITGAFPSTPRASADGKAPFIEEKTLTFTIATTGGLAVLTACGLLGMKPDGWLVVEVAAVIGLLVTVIGTPWMKPPADGPQGPEFVRSICGTVVIGLFNTALLAVALWGSVTALETGLL